MWYSIPWLHGVVPSSCELALRYQFYLQRERAVRSHGGPLYSGLTVHIRSWQVPWSNRRRCLGYRRLPARSHKAASVRQRLLTTARCGRTSDEWTDWRQSAPRPALNLQTSWNRLDMRAADPHSRRIPRSNRTFKQQHIQHRVKKSRPGFFFLRSQSRIKIQTISRQGPKLGHRKDRPIRRVLALIFVGFVGF